MLGSPEVREPHNRLALEGSLQGDIVGEGTANHLSVPRVVDSPLRSVVDLDGHHIAGKEVLPDQTVKGLVFLPDPDPDKLLLRSDEEGQVLEVVERGERSSLQHLALDEVGHAHAQEEGKAHPETRV